MDNLKSKLKDLILFKFDKNAIYFVNKKDSIIQNMKEPIYTDAILIHSGFQGISNSYVVNLNVFYKKNMDENTYEGLTHFTLDAILDKVLSGEWKVMSSYLQKEDNEVKALVEDTAKIDQVNGFDYTK